MKANFYTLVLVMISVSLNAQYYDFVSFNKTYFTSDNWTSVSNGEVWDDPSYEIPLPFDFELYGETINKIFIMDDGYGAQLGSKADYDDTAISIVLPVTLDIIDRGYSEGVAQSEIRYTTESTGDNELFIIEWFNVGFYGEFSANNNSESYMSFQVIFNRNFNALEFSYGESNIVNPSLVYEEATGAGVCLIRDDLSSIPGTLEAICLTGDANNPSSIFIEDENSDIEFLESDIPENKSYLFSVSDNVSTDNQISADEVQVYPSPTTGLINILSEHTFESFTLYSSMGELIVTQSMSSQRIDISDYRMGAYFLELRQTDGSTATIPVVKH